jgi:hypothetical protein
MKKFLNLQLNLVLMNAISHEEFHEIQCPVSDIYNVKKKLESVRCKFHFNRNRVGRPK